MSRFSIFILSLLLSVVCVLSMGCVDDGGDPVDWWIALKHPKGTKYQYMDARSSSMALSEHDMSDAVDGALAHTLSQIYTNSQNSNTTTASNTTSFNFAYAKYNDEEPDGTTVSDGGHMKGVIGFDGNQGFWLVHSVPKFPAVGNTYEGCCLSTTYGQSFMCVTLGVSAINELGATLQIDVPHVYDSYVPSSMQNIVPDFYAMTKGTTQPNIENGTLTISTEGGQSLTVLAKNPNFHVQFYEAIMAPVLNSPLLVESWQDGPGNLPAYCEPTQEFDVTTIRTLQTSDGTEWKVTNDHSKWAITGIANSTTAHYHVVCVGDINRQSSQAKRGGGAVCVRSTTVWQSFHNLITSADECAY